MKQITVSVQVKTAWWAVPLISFGVSLIRWNIGLAERVINYAFSHSVRMRVANGPWKAISPQGIIKINLDERLKHL